MAQPLTEADAEGLINTASAGFIAAFTALVGKGIQGIQGVDGIQGIQGIQGVQGVDGGDGAAGPQLNEVLDALTAAANLQKAAADDAAAANAATQTV
jgi:hypothetical protein